MPKANLYSAIVLCFCLASCRIGHQSIRQGVIRYQIAYSGNLGPSTGLLPKWFTLCFKDDKLAMAMDGGLGKMKPIMVIDGIKGKITNLEVSERILESRNLLPPDTSLKATGQKQEIMHY